MFKFSAMLISIQEIKKDWKTNKQINNQEKEYDRRREWKGERREEGKDWLNGVLRRFQQYFSNIVATAHIIHVFPGILQY